MPVKVKKTKKQLEKKELLNREKSKLACLIRKKYTALFKESIKQKNKSEKYYCCQFCKKMTKKNFYKFITLLIQGIVSFLSIVVYVMGTYYDEDNANNSETDLTVIKVLKWVEVFIALVITIEYIIKLIKRKNKWEFVFKYLNILDVIAVIPTYISLILENFKGLGFTRIFRMVRLLRIFKIYKTVTDARKDKFEEEKNVIFMRLLSAIFTVLAFVFLSTGIVHFLNQNLPDYFRIIIPSLDTYQCQSGNFTITEYEAFREGYKTEMRCSPGDTLVKVRGKLTFDLAFYYMVITMATVGYGDIYPDTSWMRLVIGLFVILSIITISKQTSELNDLIKLNSEYQVAYKESNQIKHVILSGFFNKSSLVKFLNEFYHADHNSKTDHTKIIIVQSEYPDKEIQSILINPKFEESLHYIIGDIFSESTLKLANVAKAETIFLISDQHDPESIKNDQYLILACKALSQYSSAKIYIQFNHSQFLLHEWVDWDLAFSSQKIKMNIIVKNAFISGLATMIMNLSSSSSSIYSSDLKEKSWMLEYIHGASQEIYIIEIPQNFQECSFKEFLLRTYFENRSLIIGVKKKIKYKEDKDIFYFIYLLNPLDYTLTNEDSLIIISSNFDNAQSIFTTTKNKDSSFDKFKSNSDNKLDKLENQQLAALFRDENGDNKKRKSQADMYGSDEENNNQIQNKLGSNLGNLNKDLNFPSSNFKNRQTIGNDEYILNNGQNNYNNLFENSNNNKNDVSTNNFDIPEIFQKCQYFKIWENNSSDFDDALKNHYIIFCKEDQLWEFMIYFNQYHSQVIFFISDQHPSNKLMITKRYFRNLVYIECSYSDQDDLIKLNLELAKHVYILTYTVENSNVSDSGILPLIKIIEENFPKCNYTLELSDELNVRYMNNKGFDSDSDDETKLNIIEKEQINMTNKTKHKKAANYIPVRLLPKFAKSDIFFCSSMESLLAFSYHNDGFLDVLSKLLGIDNDANHLSENKFMENPDISMYRFVGEKLKYEKAINFLMNLKKPVIPIAIYRTKSNSDLQNKLAYIITNPEKNFFLYKYDKIICIGETSASENFNRYSESDFDNSQKTDEEDNSEELEKININHQSINNRRNAATLEKKKFKKNIEEKNDFNKRQEELDNLNEEELLEKLRIEINNLKNLSQTKTNNPLLGFNKIFSEFQNSNEPINENYNSKKNIKKSNISNFDNNNEYNESPEKIQNYPILNDNKNNEDKKFILECDNNIESYRKSNNINHDSNGKISSEVFDNFSSENNKILSNNNNNHNYINKTRKNYYNSEINNIIEENYEENDENNINRQESGQDKIKIIKNKQVENKKLTSLANKSKLNKLYKNDTDDEKESFDNSEENPEDYIDVNKISNKYDLKKNESKKIQKNKNKNLSETSLKNLNLFKNEEDIEGKGKAFNKTAFINNFYNEDKLNMIHTNESNNNLTNDNKETNTNANNKQDKSSIFEDVDKNINKISRFVNNNYIKNSNNEENKLKDYTPKNKNHVKNNNKSNKLQGNIKYQDEIKNENFYCLENSEYFEDEDESDSKYQPNKTIKRNPPKNNFEKFNNTKFSGSKNNENGHSNNKNKKLNLLENQDRVNSSFTKLEMMKNENFDL